MAGNQFAVVEIVAAANAGRIGAVVESNYSAAVVGSRPAADSHFEGRASGEGTQSSLAATVLVSDPSAAEEMGSGIVRSSGRTETPDSAEQ